MNLNRQRQINAWKMVFCLLALTSFLFGDSQCIANEGLPLCLVKESSVSDDAFLCSLDEKNQYGLPYLMGKTPHPTGLPLYYWRQQSFVNFGDYISLKLIERIVNGPVSVYIKRPNIQEKKLLAIGSIFYFASQNDVVWGSGINGKTLLKSDYRFSQLDVRAVRGPLTRRFLKDNFNINAPEIYGDPALLFPYFFPEFKKKANPRYEYVIIPHYKELKLFPKDTIKNVVYPTEPWDQVIEKILDSKFVISSSLHGLVIAEAYGIPARMLRVTEGEFLFKYQDYYHGTQRPNFKFATSVEEALRMGGEKPFKCDLKKLYDAFPFEFWPNTKFRTLNLNTDGKYVLSDPKP